MYKCGLSVSYKRVLQIENTIAHNLCENFKKKGLVCPTNLRKGLFTTFAYDNIDHNPSSFTAQDSFHGTEVSIFQHPDSENLGTQRETVSFSVQKMSVRSLYQRDMQPFCQLKSPRKISSYLKMKIGVSMI